MLKIVEVGYVYPLSVATKFVLFFVIFFPTILETNIHREQLQVTQKMKNIDVISLVSTK